jgi:DnaJ family protein C protein 13
MLVSYDFLISCVFRFSQDHARSNLIWNFKTREELKDALESEMRTFNIDRELGSASVISWNHHEFEVQLCLHGI